MEMPNRRMRRKELQKTRNNTTHNKKHTKKCIPALKNQAECPYCKKYSSLEPLIIHIANAKRELESMRVPPGTKRNARYGKMGKRPKTKHSGQTQHQKYSRNPRNRNKKREPGPRTKKKMTGKRTTK